MDEWYVHTVDSAGEELEVMSSEELQDQFHWVRGLLIHGFDQLTLDVGDTRVRITRPKED